MTLPDRRRRALSAIGGVLVVALFLGAWRAHQVVRIVVAYKAKMLCSGRFVSHRDQDAVLADLQVDDLSILRYIPASVDGATQSVTATALGIVMRRAVYREDLGCALVSDLDTPAARHANDTNLIAPAIGTPPASAEAMPMATDGKSAGALKPVIDRAFSEADPERPRRTQAVVVVHRGAVVGERYAAGIRPDTPLIGWSMTKSVMNALVGILVGQGRMTLDQPAPIPAWHGVGDPRAAITLDHLLRMSSGLRFDEGMNSVRADVVRMLLDVGDAAGFAAEYGLVASPGTRWQYSSGASNIIARAVRNTLRDDSAYLAFPRHALFDRLGMGSAVLETDAAGTFVGSSYMWASARDWGRLGMLYLQDGMWGGERVLPQGWVSYSRSPAPADPARHYGAHFWLRVPDEYCGEGDALPRDAFHAVGHEGQFVTIVPSRDTVIVRLGRARYPSAWDQCAFVRQVLDALGG